MLLGMCAIQMSACLKKKIPRAAPPLQISQFGYLFPSVISPDLHVWGYTVHTWRKETWYIRYKFRAIEHKHNNVITELRVH